MILGIGDMLMKVAGKVLGSSTEEGQNQFLELFKGQEQKKREFLEKLEILDKERTEAILKDRMSAREMQISALAQNDVFSKRYVYYLASAIIGTVCMLSIVPLFFEIPEANESLINRATDFFYTIGGVSVLGYFFGAGVGRKINKIG